MVETVDHDNVDDWVVVIILSSLIDWLVDVCISVFIVVSEDEIVFDIDISVITVEAWVNNAVSDMIVEDIDGYIELLTMVIGWTDDTSKIDVIMFELWSESDDGVAGWVVVICVDDNDELSIELETPLFVIVPNSVSGEDVSSMVGNVVSLLVLEILFVVVEVNWVVDSSDSIDEVWSLCELDRWVSIDGSENISVVVDISDDGDKEEYSVEVETCSFLVVKVLVKNSVDSDLVLDTAGV